MADQHINVADLLRPPISIDDLLTGPAMVRLTIGRHGEPEVEVPGVTTHEQIVNALAMLAERNRRP